MLVFNFYILLISDELTDGTFVIKSNVGVSYATQKPDEKQKLPR